MISPDDAAATIHAQIPRLPAETRPLHQLHGAVLRQSIRTPRDQPPFHRVTMDGIACLSSAVTGLRQLRIAGTQAAGSAPQRLADTQSCFEVMTGAVLPVGCDCVIPVERLEVADGMVRVQDDVPVTPWLNVHTQGLDARTGDPLLAEGMRIGPTQIALVASAGLDRVAVSRSPRITVISTGNELIEPGEPIADWQIYRSNAYAILNALRLRGYEASDEHLPDDPQVLRERLGAQLEQQDVLILSGGVSMGRFDFVPQVLTELGVEVIFHKVAQRPGKPLWFGVSRHGKSVFALPGNPVSTLVCLARYVFSGLEAAQGAAISEPQRVALGADYEVRPPAAVFLPVSCCIDDEARLWAEPRPTRGSGDFISLLGTDGFVETPPGPRCLKRGTLLPFYPW